MINRYLNKLFVIGSAENVKEFIEQCSGVCHPSEQSKLNNKCHEIHNLTFNSLLPVPDQDYLTKKGFVSFSQWKNLNWGTPTDCFGVTQWHEIKIDTESNSTSHVCQSIDFWTQSSAPTLLLHRIGLEKQKMTFIMRSVCYFNRNLNCSQVIYQNGEILPSRQPQTFAESLLFIKANFPQAYSLIMKQIWKTIESNKKIPPIPSSPVPAKNNKTELSPNLDTVKRKKVAQV